MPDVSRKDSVEAVAGIVRRQGSLLTILAGMLVLVPFLPAPRDSARWHGAQSLGVEVGVVLLLMVLLSRRWVGHPVPALLQLVHFPPLACLSLLLGWGLLSYTLAPDKVFATQGLFSLAGGVFLVFLVCAQVREPARTVFLLNGLLGACLLAALASAATYGSDRTQLEVGVFHDHQLFGAFLLLMLPLSLSVSLSPAAPPQRLFAQAVVIVCQIALLAARTRSSWVGEGIAVLTFGGLFWVTRPDKLGRSRVQAAPGFQAQKIVPAALVLLAAAVFIILSPEREAVATRAKTLTTTVLEGHDESFRWRIETWTGAERMIREKPILGWGIGSYPRFQSEFTGNGRPVPQVWMRGPLITNEAHNSYLQIWAETGLIGLVLWLTTLASFLIAGIRALRRLPTGSLEQRVLIGGVSALVGQMTDALANPAWQFASVSLYFWVILGLIAALSHSPTAPRAGRSDDALTASSPAWWVARSVAGLALGIWLLRLLWQTAVALPAPYL